MAEVGADIVQLTQLSKDLRTSGGQFVDIKGTLDRAVQSVVWRGQAAERFKQEWQQFAPTLVKLQTALDDAAREVDRRRDAIDHATR
jgi:WXG100 family type VII secretion target